MDTFCFTTKAKDFNNLPPHEADLFYSISLEAMSDDPNNSLAIKVIDYYLSQRTSSPSDATESTFIETLCGKDNVYIGVPEAITSNDYSFLNLFISTAKNKQAVEAYIFNMACGLGNAEVVKQFNANRTEEELKDGLLEAIKRNRMSIVEILVLLVKNAKTLGNALVFASSIGSIPVMVLILKRLPTDTAVEDYPDSRYIDDALVEATRGMHKDAVEWLLDNGANGYAYDSLAYRLAILNGWTNSSRQIRDCSTDISPASPKPTDYR